MPATAPRHAGHAHNSATIVHQGDCLEVLQGFASESVDSIVTDPPAGIGFMGKEWDTPGALVERRPRKGETWDAVGGNHHPANNKDKYRTLRVEGAKFRAFLTPIFAECYRVLKPGGHAVIWALPRTSHWTGTAIEDAGFEVRDVVTHHFGCLSDDTEILTERGWLRRTAVVRGLRAACFDPLTLTLTWQPISDVTCYPHDEVAYHIRSPSTDQLVSRNHRCLVERDGALVFEYAEDLARERQARVPILEGVRELLQHLPLPYPRAGRQDLDMLAPVRNQARLGNASSQAEAPTPTSSLRPDLSTEIEAAILQRQVLLNVVRGASTGGTTQFSSTNASHRSQGPLSLDGREPRKLPPQDDRRQEPRLERWRDDVQEPRELRWSALHPLPAGVRTDGEEGRLRDGAPTRRCQAPQATSHALGSRSPQEPRPQRQSTREPHAVCVQQGPQAVRSPWSPPTTLASITPVHYEGIVWCIRVPTGAFVARRKGHIFLTGNSGFPKSLDVSKAIDKSRGGRCFDEIREHLRDAIKKSGLTHAEIETRLGYSDGSGIIGHWIGRSQPSIPTSAAWEQMRTFLPLDPKYDEMMRAMEREVIGHKDSGLDGGSSASVSFSAAKGRDETGLLPVTSPASAAALEWSGWGTALKPATEFWFLARKPLEATVAANVLQHGTGALNIDGCRVGNEERTFVSKGIRPGQANYVGDSWEGNGEEKRVEGRWPANLVLSHAPDCSDAACALSCAVAEMDRQSGVRPPGHFPKNTGRSPLWGGEGGGLNGRDQIERYTEPGGASRFFYVPKPTTRERSLGGVKNTHPTVKPIQLMRYLLRLVTPPGGLALDPFAGSGTTGCAAVAEGFRFIGIERESAYVRIARRRIAAAGRER